MSLIVVDVRTKLVSNIVSWSRDMRIMRNILSLRVHIKHHLIWIRLIMIGFHLWYIWKRKCLSHALTTFYVTKRTFTVKAVEILSWVLKCG